jgi:hypothetical protein
VYGNFRDLNLRGHTVPAKRYMHSDNMRFRNRDGNVAQICDLITRLNQIRVSIRIQEYDNLKFFVAATIDPFLW